MFQFKAKVIQFWKKRSKVIVAFAVGFLLWPLAGSVRDRLYNRFLEPADYSLAVELCAPIGIMQGEFISESTGKHFPTPATFIPTPFNLLLKNDGARYLDDNEFLVLFSKDESHSEVADKTDLKVTKILLASRSPLDQAGVSAKVFDNQLRVTAKRFNPGDFIYAEGVVSRPVSVEVFSRSVGLSRHETRGAAGCPIFPQNLGKIYVFFNQ
jgi:hypothetical protein